MRQDAAALLFLLILKDFVSGSPSRVNFSIPTLISEKMLVPFLSNFHGEISEHVQESLYDSIVSDKWCLSSLQIQWNAEIRGGFENLISYKDAKSPHIETAPILQLDTHDLELIKSSCIHHCIKQLLFRIQNAVSHVIVINTLTEISLYIHLYNTTTDHNDSSSVEFLNHLWEKTFSRFLKTLPSSKEDAALLKSVISFLLLLLPFYKTAETCWIKDVLKDPIHPLLDLLDADKLNDENMKELGQELLKLITICVTQERYYIDYYSPLCNISNSKESWLHIIKMIEENLRFSESQHFYNLAFLDTLLSCLVNLTAVPGWTNSKTNTILKDPIPQMISSLCELMTAFHCGKGPSATVSVMGLSISKNVLLTLNNILAEVQLSKALKWEDCFFNDVESSSVLQSFLTLWASRDVILRAAALQFFTSLTVSEKAALQIINDLKYEKNTSIYELVLLIVIDQTEAGIVRENAAYLMVNLTRHVMCLSNKDSDILTTDFMDFVKELINLINEFDFYTHLQVILTALFTLDSESNSNLYGIDSYLKDSESSSSSQSSKRINITTPGFIKAISVFLHNLLILSPNDVLVQLNDRGLVKVLFKTLTNPAIAVNSFKKLVLYCDLLEMNTNICKLLAKLCVLNGTCLGTVLHTRDCFNVMLSLLDPKIYHIHLPQLLYLRNKLWTELFNLSSILLGSHEDPLDMNLAKEALTIFTETITDLGTNPFVETLFESLCCIDVDDLQTSSLHVLISFLKIECQNSLYADSQDRYMENLLDKVKAPKSVIITYNQNIENLHPKKTVTKKHTEDKKKHGYKWNLLEEVYYGNVIQQSDSEKSLSDVEISFTENQEEGLMTGSELCKIMLYLYEVTNITKNMLRKKKPLILAALSGLLCLSHEAKKFALQKGLMESVIKGLRDGQMKLSLESVESLRRVQDKKRICPLLKELIDLIGILTNFMLNSEEAKYVAVKLNLADVMHKLWIWFSFQSAYVVDVLKMLCVYTTYCNDGCQSLSLTSAVAGSGPRKVPSNVSLLHVIINVVSKEMDMVSKTHDLLSMELAFNITENCCQVLECRVLISKSNLFQCVTKLHPAVTKKQTPWENIELLWLEFLQTFTKYPEGQSAVAKANDVMELVFCLTSSSKIANRQAALSVLKNLSFYQPNRPRLLSSGDFLNILQSKLMSGSKEEKRTAVVIIWSLAANNQKAKLIFKSAQLDSKLENMVRHYQLLPDKDPFDELDLQRICSVLSMLRSR